MSALFVAGAGTDIGKTYVTERLIRHALRRRLKARALKPVASGVPRLADPAFLESDTAHLLRAQDLSIDAANVAACSPWRFKAPLSPDMAAAREGRRLALSELAQWTRRAIAAAPAGAITLVEGVGGVMSPVCEDATNLDWILALGCPTLLVAGSYLGAISHCLTAIEAMTARRARLAGVIINESARPSVDPEETAMAIRRFAPGATVAISGRDARDLPDAATAMLDAVADE